MPESNWDLTPFFSALGAEDYTHFRRELAQDVAKLQQPAAGLQASNLVGWCALLEKLEEVSSRGVHLSSYLGCRNAADSRDQEVQRVLASAAAARTELRRSTC